MPTGCCLLQMFLTDPQCMIPIGPVFPGMRIFVTGDRTPLVKWLHHKGMFTMTNKGFFLSHIVCHFSIYQSIFQMLVVFDHTHKCICCSFSFFPAFCFMWIYTTQWAQTYCYAIQYGCLNNAESCDCTGSILTSWITFWETCISIHFCTTQIESPKTLNEEQIPTKTKPKIGLTTKLSRSIHRTAKLTSHADPQPHTYL